MENRILGRGHCQRLVWDSLFIQCYFGLISRLSRLKRPISRWSNFPWPISLGQSLVDIHWSWSKLQQSFNIMAGVSRLRKEGVRQLQQVGRARRTTLHESWSNVSSLLCRSKHRIQWLQIRESITTTTEVTRILSAVPRRPSLWNKGTTATATSYWLR